MAFKMKGFSGFKQKIDPPKPGRLSEKEQQEAADKVREEEKRLLDEATRKREEQGKVTATINPAFKKNGITEDEKKRIAKNQDPPSGRSQEDEIYHDIVNNKKEIRRFEKDIKKNPEKYKNLRVSPVINLTNAMNENIKEWEKLTGKKYGQGVFE